MNSGGFSWKRFLGISKTKARLSRATGIPTTKSGRAQKAGRTLKGNGGFIALLLSLFLD